MGGGIGVLVSEMEFTLHEEFFYVTIIWDCPGAFLNLFYHIQTLMLEGNFPHILNVKTVDGFLCLSTRANQTYFLRSYNLVIGPFVVL